MTRPAHDIIWGYNDTILLEFVDGLETYINTKANLSLPLMNPFIALQNNNSVDVRTKLSQIYSGKVRDVTHAHTHTHTRKAHTHTHTLAHKNTTKISSLRGM
jgi:hypothetical protein